MSVTMESMGIANQGWGVCGFTSTFYAMWANNPGSHPALINAPKPFSVLAEIKEYLKRLQAEGNTEALKSITDFTRSFGKPYNKFDVDKYIDRINKALHLTGDQIQRDPLFGIAMPPQSVADYAKRIWDFDCKITMGEAGGDAIIGVKNCKGSMTEYRGLCHYLYRYNNVIYSWGRSFTSLRQAGDDYAVVWTLHLTRA